MRYSHSPFGPGLPGLIAAGVLLISCGESAPAARQDVEAVAQPEPVPQETPSATSIPPLAGELSVAVDGDRVSLRVGGVPRLRVVEKLAESGGFELHGSTGRDLVTMIHVDASLADVLAALLRGEVFTSEWVAAEPGSRGTHRLAALRIRPPTVGDPTIAANAKVEVPPSEDDEEARRARERPPPSPPAAPKDQGTLLDQLTSRDPEDRMEALVEMDTRGFGTDEVIAALDDPDPEVRVTALERLAEDDTFVGTAAIVDALRSEHPEVVLRSLELLAHTGDPSLAGIVAPLLFHPDPDVREAAEEALVDVDDSEIDLPVSTSPGEDES